MVKFLNVLTKVSCGVALALSLSACGEKNEGVNAEQESETAATAPYPSIGGSQFCKENPTDELCIDYRFTREKQILCSPKYLDIHGGNPECLKKQEVRRTNPGWTGDNPRTAGKNQ